jgi:hypothetical protein
MGGGQVRGSWELPKPLLLAFLFLSATVAPAMVQAAATEPYGLAALAQFERLPYLKLDTLAGGQSSFDRAAHNGDFCQFLCTNGTEKVLLDLVGPGTVSPSRQPNG